ncbi:MAG: hypothetical protein M5U34_21025 [Chloroflexi bacterium]|nr:hypothetical protein [Chloroflexota bacterium]
MPPTFPVIPRTPTLTGSPEPKAALPAASLTSSTSPWPRRMEAGVERSGGDFYPVPRPLRQIPYRRRLGRAGAGFQFGQTGLQRGTWPGDVCPTGRVEPGQGRGHCGACGGWGKRPSGHLLLSRPPGSALSGAGAGSCVRRGQQVGAIGKPRTPPHLHFEMRTHMPYAPGPGYWEEDPAGAGWLPPSQTIWNQRLASAPGVAWLRTFALRQSQPLGLWRENSFLTVENGRLTATHLPNGTAQLSPLTTTEIETGLLHKQSGVLFLATKEGDLLAFAQALLWQFKLSGSGQTALLPLAHGGVMAVRGREALGLSAEGGFMAGGIGGTAVCLGLCRRSTHLHHRRQRKRNLARDRRCATHAAGR